MAAARLWLAAAMAIVCSMAIAGCNKAETDPVKTYGGEVKKAPGQTAPTQARPSNAPNVDL